MTEPIEFPEADASKMCEAWAEIREVLERYGDNEAKMIAMQRLFGRAGVHLLQAASVPLP